MNSTVQKLMALADGYALQTMFDYANMLTTEEYTALAHRQVLKAELVRLFTPLTEEQITSAAIKAYQFGRHAFAREIEACHGITGESK